jgi:hypothetical protein
LFRLSHPKLFYFIFQTSNVLVISRIQWLFWLKDKPRKIFHIAVSWGARGGVAVKALRYKPEGRWIDAGSLPPMSQLWGM